MAPLRLVNGIDVPAGLNAEPRPSTPRRVIPVNVRHVDTGAGIELEGWVRAMHLQVHAGV